MTTFDKQSGELGDWFAFFSSRVDFATGETIYDNPEEGAAEFRIRSMGLFFEERRKSLKKEHKMVLNSFSKSMERVSYYQDLPPEEEQKEMEDAWDYAITGIEGAKWEDGSDIECDRDSKIRLSKIPVFRRFIFRVFEILDETGIKQKEASEKNSSTPQSG